MKKKIVMVLSSVRCNTLNEKEKGKKSNLVLGRQQIAVLDIV